MRFGRILLVRRSNLDRKIDGSVSALRADAVQTRSSRKARIVIRHHQDKLLIFLVRTAGLEPARGCPQGILSPLRLPFRHVRKQGKEYIRPQRIKDLSRRVIRVRYSLYIRPHTLSQSSPLASVTRPSRSKNLFGSWNIASITPPSGVQATCRLPAGRHTNSPGPTESPASGPSLSTRRPSST